MAMGPRLDLRQKQSLVMTPQLQQAIRLLALSNLEIEGYVREEVERNPLLEMDDSERRERNDTPSSLDNPPSAPKDDLADRDGNTSPSSAETNDEDWGSIDTPSSDELIAGNTGQNDQPLDVDHQESTFHHDCASDAIGLGKEAGAIGSVDISSGSHAGGDGPDFENMLAAELTLQDHLRAQLGTQVSGTQRFIAEQIIGHVDDNGYLAADCRELSMQVGADITMVEDALHIVQSLDPPGVGARNLSECIAIQARQADRYDPIMARMIDNLDLLARGDMAKLKRLCGVDDEDLRDMIAEIRNYDPKPGSQFDNSIAAPVVPDVFVRAKGHGWAIELNSATLPRVLINRSYHAELQDGQLDKIAQSWLNDCLTEANWLVRALDQRQRTITKVTLEIVKQQDGFFRHGVSHLKPLTLRQVADAVEMHESTISRVTSRKYLSCARGLYELKYFFTSAIQSADGGDSVSAEAVKAALKALIDNEEPKKILSDDKLVAMLKDQGFDIARRTVAKYREAMGLGSSVQRRRQKALAGK